MKARKTRRNPNPTCLAECRPGQRVWVPAVVTAPGLARGVGVRIAEGELVILDGEVEVRL